MKLPREVIGQNPPPHARQSNSNGYYHQEYVMVQPTSNHNGNNSRGTYGWEAAQNYQNENNYQYHPQTHQEAAPLPPNDSSNPFAEYAWMVDAEEFDKQIMEEMQQQDYFESCFEQMWLEEENDGDWYVPQQEATNRAPPQTTQTENTEKLSLEDRPQTTRLNPNAAEFVPRSAMVHQ